MNLLSDGIFLPSEIAVHIFRFLKSEELNWHFRELYFDLRHDVAVKFLIWHGAYVMRNLSMEKVLKNLKPEKTTINIT